MSNSERTDFSARLLQMEFFQTTSSVVRAPRLWDSEEWPITSFTRDNLIFQGNCSLPTLVRVILAAVKSFVANPPSIPGRHLISEEGSGRTQVQ